PISSASRKARPETRRTSSRPGGSSSSVWPKWRRPSSYSKTSSGPTPVCSTSSSICSTGRGAIHSSCWHSPDPSSPTSDRPGVPETLHALVAARLDSLTPEERRLVECGAVLGKTFTKQGLAAVSGVAEEELDPLLAGLLGKEIISVQADPRSPERGQYSFLQD